MNYSIKQTMSTDLITVHVNDKLEDAYVKMKKNAIRHLPVIEDSGRVVGVISDRDFQRGMKLTNYEDMSFGNVEANMIDGARVCNFMNWPIKTISTHASLEDASWMMMSEKISALLVTEENKMVGIITHEDLLRVLVELLSHPRKTKDEKKLTKFQEWTYKSPIGQIAKFLSDSGI